MVDADAALPLAQAVEGAPGLELAGVMGWEGHLLLISDEQEKEAAIRKCVGGLVDAAKRLRAAGMACPIVSCGGTGSSMCTLGCPGVTEVQAGGVIFMDRFYRERCQVREFDFALTILTTVVSRPVPDRAIIDAGRKTMNLELSVPFLPGREDIEITNLSAEHGLVGLKPSAQSVRIGDRLEWVPGYGDLTTMLHDRMYAFRDGRLAEIWPLEGRGRLD